MAVRPIDGTWSKFVWNLGEKSESLARKFREGKACLIDLRLAVDAQPALIPPNKLKRAGLYGKYTVLKNEDGSLITNCFVLRPEKDPAAVAALRAYAATTDNAELADDIVNWVGAKPNAPLELEELRDMNVNQWVWLEFPRCSADEDYWERAPIAFHMYSHENYGKTWFAYRRPPEGEV